MGLSIGTIVIGPRCDWQDHSGDWARVREIGDSGALLVRPDQHVAARFERLSADPVTPLRAALNQILAR